MTCIVAYDIEENPARSRLARYLLTKGVRLQKSVFAVEVERYAFKRFMSEVQRIATKKGKVAVFRLCTGCQNTAIQLSNEENKPFYVF